MSPSPGALPPVLTNPLPSGFSPGLALPGHLGLSCRAEGGVPAPLHCSDSRTVDSGTRGHRHTSRRPSLIPHHPKSPNSTFGLSLREIMLGERDRSLQGGQRRLKTNPVYLPSSCLWRATTRPTGFLQTHLPCLLHGASSCQEPQPLPAVSRAWPSMQGHCSATRLHLPGPPGVVALI